MGSPIQGETLNLVGQDDRRVGAERQEADVSDQQLSGKTRHDVPGDANESIQRRQDQESP